MKKKKIIVIALAVVFAVLLLLIGVTLGRRSGGGDTAPGEQSGGAYQDADVEDAPELTEAQAAAADASADREEQASTAELPIDERILGKWEDKDMGTLQYNCYYEFFPDGSLLETTYRLHDKDYPENWYTHDYEYYFDTWRGQVVLESKFFMGYAHHKIEFYELDGRQAMDIITIRDDTTEYVSQTLLRVEEGVS